MGGPVEAGPDGLGGKVPGRTDGRQDLTVNCCYMSQGTAVTMASFQVSSLHWNWCPACRGIGVQLGVEYAGVPICCCACSPITLNGTWAKPGAACCLLMKTKRDWPNATS